ncbi:hypothetical protein WJX74_000335 [Apatococcus lobatus]|uniref:Uncharacterized protein n=1 Tax=Apatococcus lobatus TaxID=904363 RepID=A0AAW1SAI4_9CHLO
MEALNCSRVCPGQLTTLRTAKPTFTKQSAHRQRFALTAVLSLRRCRPSSPNPSWRHNTHQRHRSCGDPDRLRGHAASFPADSADLGSNHGGNQQSEQQEEEVRKPQHLPHQTFRFRDRSQPKRDVSGRWWCWAWDSSAWWAAFFFLIGSFLFGLGSACAVSQWIVARPDAYRITVLYVFALGSVGYTLGAWAALQSALSNLEAETKYKEFVHNSMTDELHTPTEQPNLSDSTDALLPENLLEQAKTGWRAAAELGEVIVSKDAQKHRVDGELAVCPETGYSDSVCRRIAVMSTAITALGAFLFNLNCFTPVWLAHGGNADIFPFNVNQWLVVIPGALGGICFVIGTLLAWVVTHRSISLMRADPSKPTSLCAILYLFGAIGFRGGGLLVGRLPWPILPGIIDCWIGYLGGYVLGAVCFLAGSCIEIQQIARGRIITGGAQLRPVMA